MCVFSSLSTAVITTGSFDFFTTAAINSKNRSDDLGGLRAAICMAQGGHGAWPEREDRTPNVRRSVCMRQESDTPRNF